MENAADADPAASPASDAASALAPAAMPAALPAAPPAVAPPSSAALADAASGEAAERVDVLVKLVRLLAHLAITPEIGEAIAVAAESVGLLRVLQTYSMEREEELELNVVSAITNLSYYLVDGSQLLANHEELAIALVPVLTFPNPEGMVEAARALGNLSRLAEARQTLCRVRVHEALLLLLDHTSSQVSEAACGALINLAADPETRQVLLENGAAIRLADLLLTLLSPPAPGEAGGEPAPSDVGAALLSAKTLCNLCCGCATNPLDAALTAELEQRLSGGASPPAWRGLVHESDVASLLSEWPQAATLLLQLLGRLPAADEPNFAEDEEYEESPLEELPMPP